MGSGWKKAISEARDRRQSRALVAIVAPLLGLATARSLTLALSAGRAVQLLFAEFAGMSLVFAAIVWGVRAGTPAAALAGAMICFLMTALDPLPPDTQQSALYTGLAPLLALFVLTFLATRAGRKKKTEAGLAEGRAGRKAAQVIANLGVPGLIAGLGIIFTRPSFLWTIPMLAALAEATADTVSSEIGQAFGGRPLLLPSLRRVDPGTDGAMSLLGTGTGVVAAGLVAAIGRVSLRLTPTQALTAWLAGCAGLVFDSLLGATVERQGKLGNDLVNFTSTAFAAGCSVGLTLLFSR